MKAAKRTKKAAANAATIATMRTEVSAMMSELAYLAAIGRAEKMPHNADGPLLSLLGIASEMSAAIDEIERRAVTS